jgi:hypothetical protein
MASKEQEEQLKIAERLQTKMLERWEKMLDDGSMTASDAAALSRLLAANGWNLDPARLPKGVRDKLTESVDPKQFEDDDADVLPMRQRA